MLSTPVLETVRCPECRKLAVRDYEKKYIKDFGACPHCEERVLQGLDTFRDIVLYF